MTDTWVILVIQVKAPKEGGLLRKGDVYVGYLSYTGKGSKGGGLLRKGDVYVGRLRFRGKESKGSHLKIKGVLTFPVAWSDPVVIALKQIHK